MSAWTEPITGAIGRKLKPTVLERFTSSAWFLSEGVKLMSDKGSMTMETLPIFMRHFNSFARKYVPQNEKVLLTLDGHSSRKGISWLEEATKNNVEIAKAPANTSHVLQPCDQRVNKIINTRVRHVRDNLVKAGFSNTKSARFKLISALAAIDDVSSNDIRVSFAVTGLWPMNMRFCKAFETQADRIKRGIEIGLVTARIPDTVTAEECKEVLMSSGVSAEQQLQKLTVLLRNRETTNRILMDLKRKTQQTSHDTEVTADTAASCASSNVKKKSHRLDQGLTDMSPARHLTHGESMMKLREKLEKEEEEERKKEERRKERAMKKAARELNVVQKNKKGDK